MRWRWCAHHRIILNKLTASIVFRCTLSAPKWTMTEERTRQTSKEQAQASMRPDISTSLQTAGQFTSIIHLIYSMHLIDCNYAALSVQSHTLCPLHSFTLPNMYICLPFLFPLRPIPALHLHYFQLFSPII